jgi:hypothetical protein
MWVCLILGRMNGSEEMCKFANVLILQLVSISRIG